MSESEKKDTDPVDALVDDDGLGLKKTKEKNLKKDILVIVLAVVALAAVAYYFKHYVDIQQIKQYLHPDGSLRERVESYLIFIFAMGMLIALGVPRIGVCAIGGLVYGAWIGILLNTIASVLGALGPYQIGKSVLRKAMKRRLGRHFETWKKRFQKHGFMWTLNLRLLPMANATLTGVICGACKVKVWEYVGATALGTIPQTIIFTLLASGTTGGKYYQILIGGVIFVVVAVVQWLYMKRKKKNEASVHSSK